MHRHPTVLLALLLSSATLAGQTTTVKCPGGSVTTTLPDGTITVVCTVVVPPVQAPTIAGMAATPTTVAPGGSAQLAWSLGGGAPTSLQLDPGAVPLAVTATSHKVTPTATTTYTLVATNAGGKAQAMTTVTVTTTPPPTGNSARLTNAAAHPSSVAAGAPTQMDWTSSGSNPVTIHIEQPEGLPALTPPVTARSFPVTAQKTVGVALWRVVYNRGTPACTATSTAACETWRHVSITTTATGPVDPPPGTQIWGVVRPEELGEFTAAEHDKFVVDGGDGWLYRDFHPQCSGSPVRCYTHEHGDDPATMSTAWVRDNFFRGMGYAARRMTSTAEPQGHVELHSGYKYHVANKGEANDEKRVNRTPTISMVHMGTGPGRFVTPMHSVNIAYEWEDSSWRIAVKSIMADTGGNATVCDPRVGAPTKDVMQLNSPCKLTSSYEIWGMVFRIMFGGGVMLQQPVTPAMFDATTVRNPANQSENVYAWDPRMAASKQFPGDDWSHFRGCDRERYAQIGFFQTQGKQTDEYWHDAMGGERPANDPLAIKSFVQRGLNTATRPLGQPPFSSDIVQFKQRVSHCQNRGKLGLLN